MRYSNWDVLLFPSNSKVPIQEFRTQCCVVSDKDSPYLNASFMNPQHFFNQRSLGQLPILTSFIPSLPQHSPFRVSIHSWEKPSPSRIVESLMRPEDCILYEVRIYADNVCIAGSLFSPRAVWPHVIELSSQMDKTGNQEVLRFPAFHPEVVDQYVWDAADTYGRIRVIISEGFARPHRSPPFERVKDTIVFSFQHAPLNILENCGIAWPNANMWYQLPTNLFRYQFNYGGHGDQKSYGGYGDHKELGDLHAHSPTRHDETRYEVVRATENEGNHNHETYQNVSQWMHKPFAPGPAPPPVMNWADIYRESRLNLRPTNFGAVYKSGFAGSDPFFEPPLAHRTHQAQRSIDDISMPDAGPLSASSRAMSSVNGMSYEHSQRPSITASEDDDHYQLAELISPSKTLNTSSKHTSAPSMPPVSRPSAAAQARSESYSKAASSKAAQAESKDPRQVSGSSVRSSQGGSVVETVTTRQVLVSPKGLVKSKKEGMVPPDKTSQAGSEPPSEPSSREVSREVNKTSVQPRKFVVHTTESVRVSSEAKRKRQSKTPEETSQTSELPSKKVHRSSEKAQSVTDEDGDIN